MNNVVPNLEGSNTFTGYGTVHHVSAIHSVLKSENIELDDDKFCLSALIKACCLKNDTVKVRLPNQKGLLNMMLRELEDYFLDHNQVYLAAFYKAMLATGYYGLLRVSEMAKGEHPIFAEDIFIARHKLKIKIVLCSSKTHTRADLPQKITITHQDESVALRYVK